MPDYRAVAAPILLGMTTEPTSTHVLVKRTPPRRPRSGAVLVGLEPDRAHAVNGKLLVAVLGIAGHSDRADDLAIGVANLHAAAFGENLVAGRAQQVAHEDRLLLGPHLHELGGAAHGERGIGLAVRHLEPDHGAAVLLLERFYLAAGLDHDHGERPAVELGAALEDGVDETVGLIESDGGHGSSGCDDSMRRFSISRRM